MPDYNLRSPAVKRLLRECKELAEPTCEYRAAPLEDNLFEWHFTIRGPQDTAFEGGVYHGRIMLPPEYPMKPPSIIMLTPNGRFIPGKKICLSISDFHPETWQPSWSIRTVLVALIGFLPTPSAGAIGGMDCPDEERKKMAKESLSWTCQQCGQSMRDALPEPDGDPAKAPQLSAADREALSQIKFKGEDKKDQANTQQSSQKEELTQPGQSEDEQQGLSQNAAAISREKSRTEETAKRHTADELREMQQRLEDETRRLQRQQASSSFRFNVFLAVIVVLLAILLYARTNNV